MLVSRVSSRLSGSVVAQCCNSWRLHAYQPQHLRHLPFCSSHFHTLRDAQSKVVHGQVSLLHRSLFNAPIFKRFGIWSSASLQPTEKDDIPSGNEQASAAENNGAVAKSNDNAKVLDLTGSSESEKVSTQQEESDSNSKFQSNTSQAVRGGRRRRIGTKKVVFSDSDSKENLSIDDLMKLVVEKEELLKLKHKEIEKMQDKVLRSYADMENVMDRTRREAESSKKFAIQNFTKSLLDVADNLGRASSVVKDSFSKIDASRDTTGALPLLKTLLEGLDMTEKQLAEVFRKYGVERFDPTNELFDPHRHNAVFKLPDASKPHGTVAVVLKKGYVLHDRVIRAAEVGVTEATENKEAEQSL